MSRPQNHRPQPRISVRARWFIPTKTQHLSVPFPALTAITAAARLGAEELCVILWLLADWYWPRGLSREVNAAVLAQRCGIHRQNAHRALRGLHEKKIIELRPAGRGAASVVSIEPLIQLSREIASRGASGGYSRKGRRKVEHQVDAPEPEVDAPRSINGEPGVGTSESFSSDSFNAAEQVGRGGSSSLNGKKKPHDKAAEERRRRFLLDQAAELERAEREEKGTP